MSRPRTALLGTVVGGFFGWAMVRALKRGSHRGLIGIAAGFRPGRRAAKLDILAAIAHE